MRDVIVFLLGSMAGGFISAVTLAALTAAKRADDDLARAPEITLVPKQEAGPYEFNNDRRDREGYRE